MKKFKVIVKNEILGNSERIMTLEEIHRFNLAAYQCAKEVEKHGGSRSCGMWTVESVDD